MTKLSEPLDRETMIQYLALCAIALAGLGLSLVLLIGVFRARVDPVYYGDKTFYFHSPPALNPLVDVKRHLLDHYPFPRPENFAEQAGRTYDIKKAIYDAFLADDTGAIIGIANQLSYIANPANVSYDIGRDYVTARYSNFDVYQVVDALDTTVLVTAYLFDRLNLRNAARKYYSTYHQAMRMILLPGMDTRSYLLSRRLMAARVKLRLLLDSPTSKQHADSSYVDTLIEMFLQQTLADITFVRYRRNHVIYPAAAEKRFGGNASSSTYFDPALLVAAINAATGPEKKTLVYEYCLSRQFANSDGREVCSSPNIEAMFGSRSFATATLKFSFLLAFVNRNPNADEYDYKLPDGAEEPVLVDNDKNAGLIAHAKQTFESMRESTARSLEAESGFLSDDIAYLAYRFYGNIGDQARARQSLCQIAKMRIEDADYLMLARALLKRKPDECSG